MNSFDDALNAWLCVLSRHGCEISNFVNQGASLHRIESIEKAIAYELPSDVKKLYQWADGQWNYYREAETRTVHYANGGAEIIYSVDPSPGRYVCLLFGDFIFDSLLISLGSYLDWIDILEEMSSADFDDFNIPVRNGHPVHGDYFRRGWFPFASNGSGDAYALDFDPPATGNYGQIIKIGPDVDERYVVATSMTELLSNASTCQSLDVNLSNNGRGSDPLFMQFELECW